MSRLSSYIKEDNFTQSGGRSVPIKFEQFDQILNTHCKDALKGDPIYRGIAKGKWDPYLSIDPSKYIRKSQFTENWYMLILQLLPKWRKFPNLSKSVICTTSEIDAGSWGELYQVYPYDGSKIGIAPEEHFWASFPDYLQPQQGMANLNALLHIIAYNAGIKDINRDETDPSKMKKFLNEIDLYLDRKTLINNVISDYEHRFMGDLKRLLEKYRDDEIQRLLDVFSVVLDTKGFELKTIGDKLSYGKQVWTEGKCIMKKLSTFGGFITLDDYEL